MAGNIIQKEAPWKTKFNSHLNAARDVNAGMQVALATVTTPDKFPRVRYVGHAGFWSVKTKAKTVVNKASDGGDGRKDGDDDHQTWSSCCPTFVTDGRSNKVAQIFGRPNHERSTSLSDSDVSLGDGSSDRSGPGCGFGSGGGGAVEATYWLECVKMQWRFRGRCFFVVDTVGDDPATVAAESSMADKTGLQVGIEQEGKRQRIDDGLTVTKAAVRPHMLMVMTKEQWKASSHISDNDHDDPIDDDSIWQTEVEGYYSRLSEAIRISFTRSSFTVGIIVPDEVEMMDLTDATVARRRIWRCVYNKGRETATTWEVIWDNI